MPKNICIYEKMIYYRQFCYLSFSALFQRYIIINRNYLGKMADTQANKKNGKDDKKHLLNALNESITPVIKELQADHNLQMPELAFHCAQFFHSVSKYCLQYHRKYMQDEESRKTKLIKKEQKQKKQKVNEGRSRKRQQERGNTNEKKPLPPKKPLTAYIIYFQDKKQSFVERYPSLNLSELTKLIAKQWKELPTDKQSPYLNQALEERKRFEQQMKDFKRTYGRMAGRLMSDSPSQQQPDLQAIINAENENQHSPKEPEQIDQEIQVEEISEELEPIRHQKQEDQIQNEEEGDDDEEAGSSSQVVEVQNGQDISSDSPEQNEKDS